MPRFQRKPFTIRPVEEAGDVRLVVCGELDLATVAEFVRALVAAEERSPKRLVIDATELEFIDARGLRAILAAGRRAAAGGRAVFVVGARPPICRLFRMTAIDRTVELLAEAPTA